MEETNHGYIAESLKKQKIFKADTCRITLKRCKERKTSLEFVYELTKNIELIIPSQYTSNALDSYFT